MGNHAHGRRATRIGARTFMVLQIIDSKPFILIKFKPMPKISEDIIRAVTDAAKIEEVVKDIIGERRQDNPGGLHKAGVNMTCLCPFHDDKNDGNLIIRPSTLSAQAIGRNSYRCFVCDAKGGPVQFLMNAEKMSFPDAIRWLGKKYNIPVDDVPVNWTPPPPKPVPPPLPPLAMERKWVKQLMGDYNYNPFTLWFGRLPWNDVQRRQMKRTLWQYCVGCWHDGRVVFWYIDHEGIPRSAKLMSYHADGHRDKERNPGWLYNQEGYRDICRPDEHTILKPLFGSHLLKSYPDASVNVVESEKTALIMANYFGNLDSQLWLACGGLKFLKIESMQPLIDQGRKVWLWPDKDGVQGWQEVADKLGSENVQVYTKFFDACWEPEDGDKADIADIAVRILYHPDWVPREVASSRPSEARGENSEISRQARNDNKKPSVMSSEVETSPPKPDGVTDAEWMEHLDIMKQIGDYELIHPQDEPFLDPEELRDPQLHQWREVLRQKYNFNKTKTNGKTKE